MSDSTFTFLSPPRRRDALEHVLRELSKGMIAANELESAAVDIKEEAGRRDSKGAILPGNRQNEQAAHQLAEEAACMANSPGGGTLVVGVDDKSGHVIGADTDPQWLRSRIYDLTERQLTVDVQTVEMHSHLLLVVDVPQAVQPVAYKKQYKHRVDARCVPVTITELMGGLFSNLAADSSYQPSQTLVSEVAASAEQALRGQLATIDKEKARLNLRDLLNRLGLIASTSGHLNMAGEMLLAERIAPTIDYTYRRVPGGPSVTRILEGGRSLLEEVLDVEAEANRNNPFTEITDRLQVHRIRAIPERSLREALLNAVCHRDWSLQHPTVVEHIDNHFRVTSPGGLIGGITEANIITHPSVPRYRTLMNALRLMGLVEQEGIGMDMMFAEMVRIGCRPPVITNLPDPAVRVDLYGHQVNENWYKLFYELEPSSARDDVDAALLLWRGAQLRTPFLTSKSCAQMLQRSQVEAEAAINRVAKYRLSRQAAPLLVPITVPRGTPSAWQLSPQAKDALGLQTSHESNEWVLAWTRERGRISSGEYCEITGVSQATATNRLKELAAEGYLVPSSSVGRGRGFHYRLREQPAGDSHSGG
ncbi:MAG: putative DNA binding domain-containing protein [bacterium]|nr:putative DNA binding domain-containing protein [bacterium]